MKNNNRHEVPLSITLFFLILFVLFHNVYFVYIGLAIGMLSLLSSFMAEKITYLWQRLMAMVGFVNAHIILSAIFFIILTPIAFIFRLVKGDILGLKKSDKSYFKERNHQYTAQDLKNPW